jgi:transcriptional regulator with XRE-family HTH domain
MAAELGVHRVSLARWECGERFPRGELRARYAQLLEELREAVAA